METNLFVQHLLTNINLSTARVLELAKSVSNNNLNEVMRIMAYLTEYSNLPEVPETSAVRENATLVSYDFFKNEVSYKYLNFHKYKVSEEFKNLDGMIYGDFYDIPNGIRNGHGEFEITVKYYSLNTCDLGMWLKHA